MRLPCQYCGLNGSFHGKYTNINTPRTYDASFNCVLAKTKIEIAICQSEFLADADSVLSALYLKLKAKHPNTIVSQQKAWIKDRNLCANSTHLTSCLSDKYRDRILVLEQVFIAGHSQINQIKRTAPYNYEYLFYLSKNSGDVFNDPPLQSYLKTILPKTAGEDVLKTSFYRLFQMPKSDSLIMITGGSPGLYTICEGALVLTPDNQTWLAYIDIDDQSKTKIMVLYPQGISPKVMPAPLKKWVSDLLNSMQNKNVEYIGHH